MTVTGTTAPPVVKAAPTRMEKLRANLEILFNSRIAVVGLFLVGFWLIVALFADDCILRPQHWVGCVFQETTYEGATPWLARYSPFEQFRGENLQGPSAEHWLGTDRNGRDLWARLAHGSRTILSLAPISVVVALIVGGFLGVVSGYFGGNLDEAIMFFLNALMSFPPILLYLVIVAAFPAELRTFNVVLAITIAGAPGIARLVRSLTLDIKTRDYVAAAQTRGESALYIMFVEILPNARGPIIIDAMLRIGYAVFAIGALGFLGLGLPPPSPDWGSIIDSGRRFLLAGHPWDALWGSIAIAMLVVGLNLLADGISEESQRYR